MLQKLSAFSTLALIIISAPFDVIAQTQQQPTQPPGYYWPGPMHMWGDGYGWPMWWMFPIMLLFFLAICVLIFFLMRGMCAGSHYLGPLSRKWGDTSHSALQILNERFARGEIQKNEYEEKKAVILTAGR
jgi:putative membrane protein